MHQQDYRDAVQPWSALLFEPYFQQDADILSSCDERPHFILAEWCISPDVGSKQLSCQIRCSKLAISLAYKLLYTVVGRSWEKVSHSVSVATHRSNGSEAYPDQHQSYCLFTIFHRTHLSAHVHRQQPGGVLPLAMIPPTSCGNSAYGTTQGHLSQPPYRLDKSRLRGVMPLLLAVT